MIQEVTVDFGGRPLILETGRMAAQADASVLATYGDTVVLATACVTDKPTDLPFMPLRIDFEEKMYAVGRIPGGFFKREGRPSEDAILTCRKIDRPIRPLLESGMRNDMQIIVLPLSVENDNSVDVVSMIAGAAAVHISSIPFNGPLGAVRIGHMDGEFIVNPPFEPMKEATMDLLVAATREGIVQLEMEGGQVDDEIIRQGLQMGYEMCMPVIDAVDRLRELAGKPKGDFELWSPRQDVVDLIENEMKQEIFDVLKITDRLERDGKLAQMQERAVEILAEREIANAGSDVEAVFEDIVKARLQDLAFEEGKRVDGRGFDDVRPISVDVGLLPRVHGSALFQRGETQVLTTTTLGAYRDQKLVRTLEEEEYSRFTHHYNFPPFSTGEVRGLRGAGRREIGHGAIGEKALERVLPAEEDFPYTIRLVSEVLAANASTSMAATCGCSLALMDAGVPIDAPVAGAGIGLIRRGDEYRLLTDMQGVEDFMGYMDFKIAGTSTGVTALQMDTKTHGVPVEVLAEALEKGRLGRMQILEAMNAVISGPRDGLSQFAPRMVCITVPEAKIGLVIGPGGKNVRALQADYEVSVDIEDDGTVRVFGVDADNVAKVTSIIAEMTREIEAGEIFNGKVVTITDFGAFVQLIPGRDGLLHISDIAWERVEKTEDVLKIGDEVQVKVVSVDGDGKIRLSRKELLPREGGASSGDGERSSRRDGGGGRRGRNDRGRGNSRSSRSSDGSSDSSRSGGGGGQADASSSADSASGQTGSARDADAPALENRDESVRGKAYFRQKRDQQ